MQKNIMFVFGLLALAMVTTTALTIPAYAQYGTGSTQTATPEQVAECASLGIPEFSCTEQTLLAKRRVVAAGQDNAYGSGTAMLSSGFGEMGLIIVGLAAIFGIVAAAFFIKSRRPNVTVGSPQ